MVKLINGLLRALRARAIPKPAQQQLEAIAEKIYLNRLNTHQASDEHKDWEKAVKIFNSPARLLLFRINQHLIRAEKGAIEPIANWLDKAELFRIIERISPAIGALGVLAIPLVLFFATQEYQEKLKQQESERLQQQAVKDYFSQLSTLLLDVDGSFLDMENEQLRALTEATTLAFLDEPNLDGNRKGQVVSFLSQMELVNREIIYGPLRLEDREPTVRLIKANLSGADLRETNLINTDLRGARLNGARLNHSDLDSARLSEARLGDAELSFANLRSADLRSADLNGARLNHTDLRGANLNGANLSFAYLQNSKLSGANLTGADLRGADLNGAYLIGANLNYAYIGDAIGVSQAQLEPALLCETELPKNIDIDPNRDC